METAQINLKLEQLARRLFWWKSPSEALDDPNRFLGQVMALGTWEDVNLAREHWTEDEFREALGHAAPGVFDARSWTYWHHILGVPLAHGLPKRSIG